MRKLIVVAGLLLAAVTAYASPVSMEFVSFQSGGWQAGYPYTVTINGSQPIAVMCDDWAHGGLPGDQWQANFTNLGTGNLSTLRFNQLNNALVLYEEAGWLLLETEVTSQNQWTDMNYAVWHIFDASAPLNPNAQRWLDLAQQEAAIGFPGVDFYDVGIYTPVNQYDQNLNDAQEFLRPIPEPATLTLLGAGIVGILRYKRIR